MTQFLDCILLVCAVVNIALFFKTGDVPCLLTGAFCLGMAAV